MNREEIATILYRAASPTGYGRSLRLAPDRQRWLTAADVVMAALK